MLSNSQSLDASQHYNENMITEAIFQFFTNGNETDRMPVLDNNQYASLIETLKRATNFYHHRDQIECDLWKDDKSISIANQFRMAKAKTKLSTFSFLTDWREDKCKKRLLELIELTSDHNYLHLLLGFFQGSGDICRKSLKGYVLCELFIEGGQLEAADALAFRKAFREGKYNIKKIHDVVYEKLSDWNTQNRKLNHFTAT